MATSTSEQKDSITTMEEIQSHVTGDKYELSEVKSNDGRLQIDAEGFEAELATMPKGYYYSPFFVGSFLAIGFGFWAGNSGFAYAAPILPIINNDLGLIIPWTIVGRLGDLFGRRWFFIGGAFLAMAGTLISALAVNMNMLIIGSMIKALAASTQLSCFYALGELLPAKYRYMMVGTLQAWQIPGSMLAPAIANSIVRMSGSWRGVYYLLTAINGVSFLLYFFFYHPPTFHEKQGRSQSKMEFIKRFDYIGTLFYAVGLVFFLLGLSWGGSKYPWKDPMVISFIIIGAVSLMTFFIWELKMPLREPLIPPQLLRNKDWAVATVLCGIGAGLFYAGAIIWPTLVTNFYARGDIMRGAYLACIAGSGIGAGGIIGGLVCKAIGYQKIQITITMALAGIFIAATSTATPDNEVRTCIFFFIGTFFVGYNTDISLTNAILSIKDQRTIGAAGGAATSGRTMIAGICQAVYSVVLANSRAKKIPGSVIPAVTATGLPPSSIRPLLTALSIGQHKAIAVRSFQDGLAQSYRLVWLSSLAFTGLGIVLALWSPNTGKLLTNKVATKLHQQREVEEENQRETA